MSSGSRWWILAVARRVACHRPIPTSMSTTGRRREPASSTDAGVVEEVIHEQRLTLVDPRSGATRCVSPADTYVYEYDWSPEGARIVYTAAKGSGDNNWWIAQLYTLATATGDVKH